MFERGEGDLGSDDDGAIGPAPVIVGEGRDVGEAVRQVGQLLGSLAQRALLDGLAVGQRATGDRPGVAVVDLGGAMLHQEPAVAAAIVDNQQACGAHEAPVPVTLRAPGPAVGVHTSRLAAADDTRFGRVGQNRWMKLIGVTLAAAILAGCSADVNSSDGAAPQPPVPATPVPTTSAPTVPAAGGAPFVVQEVDVFDAPWAMTFLPGTGDLLITERTGKLHLRDAGSGQRVEVDGVPDVAVAGQGGLGDVLAGPTFANDGAIFLSWAEADAGVSGAVVGRARLDTSDDGASLADLEVIWRQTPKVAGNGHFAHRLAITPDGEHLLVSSGDRQTKQPAQDTSNTLGTIVRLTLDGEAAPGNPLADDNGAAAEIWSWGHRNPLGLEFADDGTLWSSEMGPEGGDELNVIEPGGNYGWPEASNGSDYGGGEIPDHADGDGFVPPQASWTPSISPGSLMIYSGDLFPDWKGDAFLGALSGEALVRVDLDGTTAGDDEIFSMGERIRAVEQGPDGAIWLLEDEGAGRLLKLTPA